MQINRLKEEVRMVNLSWEGETKLLAEHGREMFVILHSAGTV